MLRQVALIAHLIGVVLWIGSAAAAAWVGSELSAATPEVRRAGFGAVRRAMMMVTSPAMLLAWLAGLVMLIDGWSTMYRRAGWMHGMVTVAFILSGLTGALSARIRKGAAAKGELGPGVLAEGERAASRMGMFAIMLVLGAALVIVLVVIRPGT